MLVYFLNTTGKGHTSVKTATCITGRQIINKNVSCVVRYYLIKWQKQMIGGNIICHMFHFAFNQNLIHIEWLFGNRIYLTADIYIFFTYTCVYWILETYYWFASCNTDYYFVTILQNVAKHRSPFRVFVVLPLLNL